jgi:phosphoribosylformimino-5-aminoimidazole carboxamide ribotide isomerase
MIARPAIDVRAGACVQLVGGSYADERVRVTDPLAAADRWQAAGFDCLHVVDLDAATGRGSNADVILRLAALRGVRVQVGGGIRDAAAVARLLDAGAERIVVGTRAVEDPAWLETIATRLPGAVVVAADVRRDRVVTRGWSEGSGVTLVALLERLDALPIAGVLVTAVHREGRQQGPDLAVTRRAARATRHPLIASGGVASLDDLSDLATAGAAEAVLGMALYTGTLDARAVAREYGR